MIRIFSERNQQAFNTKPSKADLSPAYDADVNCSYSNFIKILNDAFEECFPLTRLSRKRMKDKPWITSALKKAVVLKIYYTGNGPKLQMLLMRCSIKSIERFSDR